ncbi:MAG: hypothetical protein ACOYBS_07395 [Flavobacterium sp.]|jgi:hypothetical protein
MKTELKNIFAILFMALAFTSCSNDDNNEPTINELEGLTKFKEITNTSHTIELYSHTGATVQGYYEIKLRIKNNANNQYIKNAEVTYQIHQENKRKN